MWDNLSADTRRLREIKTKPAPWYVLESLLFENGYQAVVLHRLAHWFRSRGVPVLGPAIARWSHFLTGVDIAPAARIGPGLRIAHGTGIVIGNATVIGRECLIRNAIVDFNARIGDGCRLVNEEKIQDTDTENWSIRGGIIVVPKDASVPPGTII